MKQVEPLPFQMIRMLVTAKDQCNEVGAHVQGGLAMRG